MKTDTTNEVAPTKTTMNPQEINRRIAIACGWYVLPNGFPSELWEHPSGKRAYESDFNYHGDLNAMHEAEKVLLKHGWLTYIDWLVYIMFGKQDIPSIYYGNILHATAAQRAEAFLRTIGQWEEAE